MARAASGSSMMAMQRAAHSSLERTRYPVCSSTIWSGMPPTSPATVGRPFHRASVTVSPKPSRIDFCTTTSAWDWNALTSTDPTLFRLERM